MKNDWRELQSRTYNAFSQPCPFGETCSHVHTTEEALTETLGKGLYSAASGSCGYQIWSTRSLSLVLAGNELIKGWKFVKNSTDVLYRSLMLGSVAHDLSSKGKL